MRDISSHSMAFSYGNRLARLCGPETGTPPPPQMKITCAHGLHRSSAGFALNLNPTWAHSQSQDQTAWKSIVQLGSCARHTCPASSFLSEATWYKSFQNPTLLGIPHQNLHSCRHLQTMVSTCTRRLCLCSLCFVNLPDDLIPDGIKDLKNIKYLLYSRVPKCGSETTMDLMKTLETTNKFSIKIHKTQFFFEHQAYPRVSTPSGILFCLSCGGKVRLECLKHEINYKKQDGPQQWTALGNFWLTDRAHSMVLTGLNRSKTIWHVFLVHMEGYLWI